jgi:hypothetical protein
MRTRPARNGQGYDLLGTVTGHVRSVDRRPALHIGCPACREKLSRTSTCPQSKWLPSSESPSKQIYRWPHLSDAGSIG